MVMPFIEAAASFAAGQRGSPRVHHTRTQFLFLQDSATIGSTERPTARHSPAYRAYSRRIQRFGSSVGDAATTDKIAYSLESRFISVIK
jgi:hypothetical protein